MEGLRYISRFFIAIALLLAANDAFSQLNTIGREFYVGFMENNRQNNLPDYPIITISANEDAEGYIEGGGTQYPFSLKKGEQFVQKFVSGLDLIHRSSGQIENRSAYINSSGDISVYAYNERERSADGTVILPVEALGKDYFVTAHAEVFNDQGAGNNSNFESTMLIIAVEDQTTIEIVTSTATVNTIPANAPFNITLNKGQSYQIKAKGDLTGTRVKVLNSKADDCKNIAVFGGNKLTSVGSCGSTGDNLYQQAYPIKSWGKTYTHLPFLGRTSGEMVKVLASSDNTEIRVNGNVVGTINAGKFIQLEFKADEAATIETSKPTAVTAFAKSQNCNSKDNTFASDGDPSMVTYSDNWQRIKSVIFNSVETIGIDKHFVNILVQKGSENSTLLNGQNIGNQFKPVPGNPDFVFARIKVSAGANSLFNPDGLIAYAYGVGFIESYSYSVGASLENVQFVAESTYAFEVIGDRIACFEKEGTWEIIPDNPLFDTFSWDFGDGSPEKPGKEVTHTYTQEGIFEVIVFASTGEGSCDSVEEFKFEVEVKKIEGELIGPSAVCPDSDEVEYIFTNTSNFDKVRWEVTGGTELVSTDSTITIKWQNPTDTGLVRAIPLAENGCEGESQEIQVVVSDQYEPDLPSGIEGICGIQSEALIYSVPFPSDDFAYNWVVLGGSLNAGQGTTEVEVVWDFNAPTREIYYEVTSLSNSQCSGISQVLDVIIYPEFEISSIEKLSPSCQGEENGEIELVITGGSGEFEFEWQHDPNLNSTLAKNLKSGTYEVKITDLSGCGEKSLSIEIEDLEPLNYALALGGNDVSCVDSSDGSYVIKVTGGTAPYEILGFDSDWDGENLTVSGLPKGSFSHTLIDARSCSILVEGEISGPEALELNFVEENPGCPGGSDGILEVIPSGGTPPYTYQWENGFTDSRVTGLSSGLFNVTVTDSNGCTVSGTGKVSESEPQVRMPTGFNPKDGVYEPIFNCSITYNLLIWDRWGQLVYAGSDGWDGLHQGVALGPGVFTYKIIYEYPLEGEIGTGSSTGTFILIQ
ncbi:PKD domain-containing protein [Algoriphagus pacificus]|uniref:PKD domain-containing protein n=1 Tax=Algoriphagus pacificus TaxID=2811234 RepID=A0ABS3CL80_9BACT|nr:PKD domain-containing protein [Algoriphagus pacificus]MBN7816399.1 PKD domain-containing protein [Algoriphagus pacificus]